MEVALRRLCGQATISNRIIIDVRFKSVPLSSMPNTYSSRGTSFITANILLRSVPTTYSSLYNLIGASLMAASIPLLLLLPTVPAILDASKR